MPALSRTTAFAAVALAAVVGAGGVLYLNSSAPGGSGGQPTPNPTPTQIPTTEPTVAPTPQPSELFPGITGFTTYTSAVYGNTFGYPDGWHLYSAASRTWQPGPGDDRYFDIFLNPKDRDGEEVAFIVWQQPAGSGADITSHEGLMAWAAANYCDDATDACETVPDVALPMCLGRAACLPAVLVPLSDGVGAFFGDSESGLVTAVALGRSDTFPATARYGGGVQLLKSILTTMDVWTPEPGQIPG